MERVALSKLLFVIILVAAIGISGGCQLGLQWRLWLDHRDHKENRDCKAQRALLDRKETPVQQDLQALQEQRVLLEQLDQ
jgi:hypothetical protein